MSEFSFEYWSQLYQLDPEEFERKRKEVLEAEIMKAPVDKRNRLRIWQWSCDVEREGKTPLEGTIAISRMMLDSLEDMRDASISLC